MKIEDKFINLRCLWLSKCLIILSIIVFNTSCKKENIDIEKENSAKQACSFVDYSFIDNIICYDTTGNRFDSLSYMYSQDDFVFADEDELPFRKIEINADSTVIIYSIVDDSTYILNGMVTQMNDSLYFYYHDQDFKPFFFKGLIVGHQLRIPGYGCKYYVFVSDGKSSGEIKVKKVGDGIPDWEDLLMDFPLLHFDNAIINIHNMYFQRFDLIYELN